MLPAKCHIINIIIFWGLKFHESIKSMKFEHLEKTNYTVVNSEVALIEDMSQM